ncbi:hypothetical protein ES703_59315 [subsurface metagenome]
MGPSVKALPLVTLLFGLSNHHEKKYCFPSQLKIMELLWRRSGLKLSIATLNRWLRVIEDEKYIRRIRRIRRDPKLGIVFQSTVYVIGYRGYILLHRAGVQCWDKIKDLFQPKRKRVKAAGDDDKPAEKVFSLANHKKRHPGVKLPWNGSGNKGARA